MGLPCQHAFAVYEAYTATDPPPFDLPAERRSPSALILAEYKTENGITMYSSNPGRVLRPALKEDVWVAPPPEKRREAAGEEGEAAKGKKKSGRGGGKGAGGSLSIEDLAFLGEVESTEALEAHHTALRQREEEEREARSGRTETEEGAGAGAEEEGEAETAAAGATAAEGAGAGALEAGEAAAVAAAAVAAAGGAVAAPSASGEEGGGGGGKGGEKADLAASFEAAVWPLPPPPSIAHRARLLNEVGAPSQPLFQGTRPPIPPPTYQAPTPKPGRPARKRRKNTGRTC